MKNSNFIILDFETGGLKASQNPIIQVAVLTIDGKTLKEINRWESYVQPYDGLEVTQGALNANGLKMTDVNKGITKAELLKALREFFLITNPKNAPMKKPILVGHNLGFDLEFLDYIFKDDKNGLYHYVSRLFFDTYAEALRAFPNETSHKLGRVCELLGVPLVDAHKAMNDVVATTEVFKHFTTKLRNKKGEASKVLTSSEIQEKSRITYQF